MTSTLQITSSELPVGYAHEAGESKNPIVFAKPVATFLKKRVLNQKAVVAAKKTIALSGIQPYGIGHATASQLVAEGNRVICCDRDEAKGRAAVAEIDSGDIEFVPADLSRPDGVDAFLDAIAPACPLDGLICNAGTAGDPKEDDVLNTSFEHFHELINNNLTSAWLLTRGALRRFFLPQGAGAVVFLGSNNGQRGCGILGQPAYGIAKTALSGLLANCVARFGRHVRFNLVRPGVVLTKSKNWGIRMDINANWPAIEGQATPAGRLADPMDVAHLVAFLLSDKARHINGAEIPIDGGMTCAGIQFPGVIDPTRFRESYVEAMSNWPNGDADDDHSAKAMATADANP